MNKAKYFIYIISCNFLFAAGGGGSWINDWLMPNTGLTLWTITTFLVLLVVLRWKAWGPLMDALESRAKSIEESLSKAEIVAEEAKNQAIENEAILARAREESQNIVSEAKQAGEKLKAKLESDGKQQYETIISKAHDDIQTAKNKALNDIKTMVVEIALEASEKIIKRNLNNDDNQRIIEETVKSFQEKN